MGTGHHRRPPVRMGPVAARIATYMIPALVILGTVVETIFLVATLLRQV
jgi:hypothetical protein